MFKFPPQRLPIACYILNDFLRSMWNKICCNYKQWFTVDFKGKTILSKDSTRSQHHTTKTNRGSDCTRPLVFNSGIRFTSVSLLLSGRFALWQRVSSNSHEFDTRLDQAQGQQQFISSRGVGDMWSVLQAVTSQKELFLLLRGLCSISGLYLSAVNQLSDANIFWHESHTHIPCLLVQDSNCAEIWERTVWAPVTVEYWII
jgi:hypothetical protein